MKWILFASFNWNFASYTGSKIQFKLGKKSSSSNSKFQSSADRLGVWLKKSFELGKNLNDPSWSKIIWLIYLCKYIIENPTELRISSEINRPLHPVWICFLIEFGSMIADDWWWAKKMINFLCEFWFLFWQYGMFKLVFIWLIVENPRSAPFSKPIVLELWPKNQ